MKNTLERLLLFVLTFALIAGLAVEAAALDDKHPVQTPAIASKVWTGSNLTADVPASDKYEVVRNEGGIDVGEYEVELKLTQPENDQWEDYPDDVNIVLTFVITEAPACDHEWTYASNGNGTHTATCKKDGCEETKTDNCTGGIATCTEAAVCEHCGTAYGEIPDHQWTYTPNNDGTHTAVCQCGQSQTLNCSGGTATCTTQAVCEHCNSAYGDILGHDLVLNSGKATWKRFQCNRSGCSYLPVVYWDFNSTARTYTGSPITTGSVTYPADWIGDQPQPVHTENINVGNVTASVTIGSYTWTKSYKINPQNISGAAITRTSGAYTGEVHDPEIILTYNGMTLVEGIDYTLGAWSGKLTKPGTYDIMVTGIGNYTGSYRFTPYTIYPASLQNFSVTCEETLTYNGKEQSPNIEITATTVDGSPVTITYNSSTELPTYKELGTYTLHYTVSAPNHYSKSGSFKIKVNKIIVEVPVFPDLPYTGNRQRPTVPKNEYYELGMSQYGVTPGTYIIMLVLKDPEHCKWSTTYTDFVDVNFNIVKATNKWIHYPVVPDWTYGEQPDFLNSRRFAIPEFGQNTRTIMFYSDDGYCSSEVPTIPGTYTCETTVPGTDLYTGLEFSYEFTIRKATIKFEDLICHIPTDVVFAGNHENPNYESLITVEHVNGGITPDDVTVNIDGYSIEPYWGSYGDPGKYYFSVDIAETACYEALENVSHWTWYFKVGKAPYTITWDDNLTFPYGGSYYWEYPVAKITDAWGETWWNDEQYGPDCFLSFTDANGNLCEPRDVGTYTVTLTVRGDEYYHKETTSSATLTIEPATIWLDVDYASSATYTGGPIIPDISSVYANDWNLDFYHTFSEDDYIIHCTDNIEVGIFRFKVEITNFEPDDPYINPDNYKFNSNSWRVIIFPDVSALDGVTNKTVTSAHKSTIDTALEQMANAGVTDVLNTPREWWNFRGWLQGLDLSLRELAEQIQEFINDVAALPEHPTTDRLGEVEALLEEYNSFSHRLVEEEIADLADEVAKLEREKQHILDAQQALKDLLADIDELLGRELTYKDRPAVEALRARAEELGKDPHLTDAERQMLKDASDMLKIIEEYFDAAKKVEEMIDALPETAEPDDEPVRKAYWEAKNAYEDLGKYKTLVAPKYVKKLEKLAASLRDYRIISGNNQWWYADDEVLVNLTLTANGPFSKFTYVAVDGVVLDDSCYTAMSGSTIVILKADFLKNLGYARHTISIGYEDGELSGEAVGTFRVTLHTTPPTGDTTDILLISALGISSLLALTVLTVARKKRGA